MAYILFGWIFDLLYLLQMSIWQVLDFIMVVFRRLAGVENVTIDGEQQDILRHFLFSDGIRTAFLGIMLIGFVLLTVFTIVAIIRSESADGQNKKTKAQILAKSGHAALIFIVIPFIVMVGVYLSSTVMVAIDQTMIASGTGGTGNLSFGGQILVTAGGNGFIGSASERARIEQDFIDGVLDFTNIATVRRYYDLFRMNFFLGIGSGLVILVLLVIASIMFVQRIFDIILLYIVSPVSTATIPLDDGGRFRIWREMLVSKILGAYGIILSMNIFFLIIPQLNAVRFFDSSFQNGIVRLLFFIGGAFSVTRASMVIAQLTGSNAGAQEAQQMMGSIQTGSKMAKTGVAGAMAAGGMLLGGADFAKNKKRGAGFLQNLVGTAKASHNRKAADGGGKAGKAGKGKPEKDGEDKQGKKDKAGKGMLRLATMPMGIVSDFCKGGLITVGKNFVPRMANVFTGDNKFNQPSLKPKKGDEIPKPGMMDKEQKEKAKTAAIVAGTGGTGAVAAGTGTSAGTTGAVSSSTASTSGSIVKEGTSAVGKAADLPGGKESGSGLNSNPANSDGSGSNLLGDSNLNNQSTSNEKEKSPLMDSLQNVVEKSVDTQVQNAEEGKQS